MLLRLLTKLICANVLHPTKSDIFAASMSALKEYVKIISYNFRRLRYLHDHTHEYISECTEMSPMTINRIENAEMCSLQTAISLATHFKVTLNELTTDKNFDDDTLYKLQKMEFVPIYAIPQNLRDNLFNYIAEENDLIPRIIYIGWIDHIEFRGWKGGKKGGVKDIEIISKLKDGESSKYQKENHVSVLNYIYRADPKKFTLRKKQETYLCTRIL